MNRLKFERDGVKMKLRLIHMSQGAATKLQPISEPAQLEMLDWDVAPISIDFPTVSLQVKVVDTAPRPMLPA